MTNLSKAGAVPHFWHARKSGRMMKSSSPQFHASYLPEANIRLGWFCGYRSYWTRSSWSPVLCVRPARSQLLLLAPMD